MQYNYNAHFSYNNIKVPTTAFRNHLPEVIVDLKTSISSRRRMSVHERESLMVRSATLECDLTSSLLLPVFCQCSCVGVVEYSTRTAMTGSHLVLSFNELQRVLVAVPGLNVVTYEIEEALEIVCESHYLTLAQVWMSTHVNKNFIPFSSMDDPQFAIKLIGYYFNMEDVDLLSSIKGYYDTCDMFPLKIGEGLSGKTLETCVPHFCRNINEVCRDNELLALLPSDNSCLTICLRSTHTKENVDYVFEFLWPTGRDYHILVESIFLTLMRCLPHFMFPFGAKFGDDALFVVDVDNNSRAKEESISSLEVKSNPLHREDVKQEVGSTIQETATNYYGRKFVRRNLSDMCESDQCESTEEASSSSSSDGVTYPNKDMLTVKAEYGDDLIAFLTPASSATLAALKKEIHEGFELNNVRYELAYLDKDNDLIAIQSDEEVRVSIWDKPANTTHIKLYVLPLTY
ncbi:NIN-like protein [Tanacetum coccineum]